MITQEQAGSLIGGTLYDSSGDKIGKIGQVYLDDATGRPEWVTVHTGFFGTNESFVPVIDAEVRGNDVSVAFSKSTVKGAPNVDPSEGHLSEQAEEELYSYYGLSRSEARSDMGMATGMATSGTAGQSRTGMAGTDAGSAYGSEESRTSTSDMSTSAMGTSGVASSSSGDTTDDAMTRSEERLTAGTESVEAGRARLRKWVDTEQEQVTVPVTSERATLVTEPITDANMDKATSGPEISEAEHEVTLHEERPVVTTEAVPVERVRLETETETREETVTGDVRKERIDLDAGSEATSAADPNRRM